MIWSFELPTVITFLGILITGTWASLPVVFISGIVLFSNSSVVSLLALVSLHMVAFLQTATQARKSAIVLTQKAYFLRLLGCFVALFGIAADGGVYSILWIFVGLLMTLPLFPFSLFFSRHYQALSVRSFVDTVIIPSVVTLMILSRLKPEIKAQHPEVWDVSLVVLGLASATVPALFSGMSKRLRWTVVHLAQSWMGWFVFALVLESTGTLVQFWAAALGFLTLSIRWLESTASLGGYPSATARAFLLGLPGSLAFVVLQNLIPGIVSMNPLWLIWFLIVYVLNVFALIQGYESEGHQTPVVGDGASVNNKKGKLLFLLLLVVQIGLVVGLSR